MAYRNMKQIVLKTNEAMRTTKHLYHYSMSFDELCLLYKMCINGEGIDAIITAFDYGFALGTRALSRNTIKKAL